MPRGLHVALNWAGKHVLLVGFGGVGQRRFHKLKAAGAAITIVDPVGEIPSADADVRIIRAVFQPEMLEGQNWVLACATPPVNREVVAACRQRQLPVHSASDPEESDFHFLAEVETEGVVWSVGTGGQAPGVSKYLRDQLLPFARQTCTPYVRQWLELYAKYRSRVQAWPDETAKQHALHMLAAPELLEQIQLPEWSEEKWWEEMLKNQA